jgi:hypothetical protein
MTRFVFHPGLSTIACAFTLVAALALGCSSTPAADQPTTSVPPDEDTGHKVSEKGKKWEGWRWQGDRDNCYFLFKNECFDTQEAACKAAECGDGCQVKEGAPSLVSCKQ